MYRLVAFSTILAVGLGGNLTVDNRIVGGHGISIVRRSYQVAIHRNRNPRVFCGGVVVARYYCVTAAHCALQVPVCEMRLQLGSQSLSNGYYSRRVRRAIAHPRYDRSRNDYDVGVLEVHTRFIYTPTTRPIALPIIGYRIRPGTMALISGFGRMWEDGELSERLLTAKVPIWDWWSCKRFFAVRNFNVTSRMICAGYARGKIDSCQGDSGGPLVIRGVLVGVISWGRGCARSNTVGIYANIASPNIRTFIHDVTGV